MKTKASASSRRLALKADPGRFLSVPGLPTNRSAEHCSARCGSIISRRNAPRSVRSFNARGFLRGILTLFALGTLTITRGVGAEVRQPTNALRRAQSTPVAVKPSPTPTRATQIRQAAEPLTTALDSLVREGAIVGAQLAIGDDAAFLMRKNFGVRSLGSRTAVDDDTLFCLASCSKPIVAVCVLALAEQSKLNLDQPIDRWLPAFGRLKLSDGRPAARAPTVRELLAHRAGIFSQKEGMTAEQGRWKRDFTLTLWQAVDGIAGEPLIAQPGERFAYSGAGYFVLGRVAEVATGRNLETLLHDELGQHLAWRRTTYFPSPREVNIAAGGSHNNPRQPDLRIPHAHGASLRLTAVGGGLYSTASETGQFARMILRRGRGSRDNVLSEAAWKSLLKAPYPGSNYGLGWFLALSEDGTATALRHTGAHASARSQMEVLLDRNLFVVIHYTVAAASSDAGLAALPKVVRQTLTRLERLDKAR